RPRLAVGMAPLDGRLGRRPGPASRRLARPRRSRQRAAARSRVEPRGLHEQLSAVGRGDRRVSSEPLVLVEREEPLALVTLNRPEALNALSGQLMAQLVEALESLDADAAIRAIVLTGAGRAFAAGADIRDLSSATPFELHRSGHLERWDRIGRIRTPIVAAVS